MYQRLLNAWGSWSRRRTELAQPSSRSPGPARPPSRARTRPRRAPGGRAPAGAPPAPPSPAPSPRAPSHAHAPRPRHVPGAARRPSARAPAPPARAAPACSDYGPRPASVGGAAGTYLPRSAEGTGAGATGGLLPGAGAGARNRAPPSSSPVATPPSPSRTQGTAGAGGFTPCTRASARPSLSWSSLSP